MKLITPSLIALLLASIPVAARDGQPKLASQGLEGYISMEVATPPAGYGYGVSLYATAWPLTEKPLRDFQIGLASIWIVPDNREINTSLLPTGTVARDNWPERGPNTGSVPVLIDRMLLPIAARSLPVYKVMDLKLFLLYGRLISRQGDTSMGSTMYEINDLSTLAEAPTRRKVVAGFAVALGGLLVGAEAWSKPPQTAAKVAAADNKTRTSLHQEIEFSANPRRIYEALLNSKQFAAFTGMAAKIDPKVAGAFTMFGGMIAGRNIELIRNQRIVQAWRPASWSPGVYSIVKFELKLRGAKTILVLDHTGFPEGDYDSLGSGWPERYWNPLKKYLA